MAIPKSSSGHGCITIARGQRQLLDGMVRVEDPHALVEERLHELVPDDQLGEEPRRLDDCGLTRAERDQLLAPSTDSDLAGVRVGPSKGRVDEPAAQRAAAEPQ